MPTEVFLSGIVHLLLIAGATALPQSVLLQPSRGVRIALGLVAGAASTLVALQGMPLVWCLKSKHQIIELAARATDAKMVSALLCHTNGLGSSL